MSDDATLRLVAQAINNLNQTMAKVFPQQAGTSATATGGSATLPANPVGFQIVVVDGVARKVPFYS